MVARTVPSSIEVNGQSVKNILAGMILVQQRAAKMLAEQGLTDIHDDGWYPLQKFINTLYAIQEEIGPHTTRAIGRKVPENSMFPPEFQSLQQVLSNLDVAYRMNHRGPGNIGGYHHQPTGMKSCRLAPDNPYPCAFDHGLLEALGQRFRPADSLWVRVVHEPGTCREQGDASCVYTLTW